MRIFVSMSEKVPSQASSKEDLDQLSALEESMAPFGMGDLDSEHGVILKDWSAQDFANIYVRFRPHLISHARKFLRDETQAEEVVQDAFLYLMTALPELDSELGVLRFLKWKVRLLALDVIRVESRRSSVRLDSAFELTSEDARPEASIERAEDAAVVALALSRLQPRHREALIASVFEEKSTREAAQRMNLTENAFRQLLFRARTAFRVALVGEAEVAGKSVNQILSIAARKASNVARQAMSVVILLAFGAIAYFPSLIGSENNPEGRAVAVQTIQEPTNSPSSDGTKVLEPNMAGPNIQSGSAVGDAPDTSVDRMHSEVPITPEESTEPRTGQNLEEPKSAEFEIATAVRDELTQFLDIGLTNVQLGLDTAKKFDQSPSLIIVEGQSGLAATLVLEPTGFGASVDQAHFGLTVEGYHFYAAPSVSIATVDILSDGWLVTYVASDLLVGDFDGQFDNLTTAESKFSNLKLVITLRFDDEGILQESGIGASEGVTS